jgi:chromosome partitioning protein
MKTVAVLARKGGVGKTTLARILAVQSLIEGRRSAIVDCDPQQSAVLWAKRRPYPAPAIEALGSNTIPAAIDSLERKKAELVMLDTPPHSQPVINLAAESATGCIIVTGTGPEDVEQVGPMIQIVQQLKKPAVIILNRTQPRTSSLGLARAALATFGVPICPTAITQAVVHVYSAAEGLVPAEREPGSKAAAETKAVWDWLEKQGIV